MEKTNTTLFNELLGKYAPILFLHKKENFRPVAVESYLDIACRITNITNLECEDDSISLEQLTQS
ncbi:MAG: hypothetical protein ACW99Q_26995, partial [Candidatus Kariarchaeaceae archaeon]